MKKIKKESSKKKVMIALIIIAIIIILFGLCMVFMSLKDKKLVYEDYTIAEDHYGKIEEYDPSYTVDGFNPSNKRAYYIIGSITAQKDKDFTVITFNLYDKKNKLLGKAVAGLNSIEKGKTYKFKALSLVDDNVIDQIDHYELEKVELGN